MGIVADVVKKCLSMNDETEWFNSRITHSGTAKSGTWIINDQQQFVGIMHTADLDLLPNNTKQERE